jgi:hypothetical protein
MFCDFMDHRPVEIHLITINVNNFWESLTSSWNHFYNKGKDNSVVTEDFQELFISLQWLQKCKFVQRQNFNFSFSNFTKLHVDKWVLFILAEYIFLDWEVALYRPLLYKDEKPCMYAYNDGAYVGYLSVLRKHQQ